MGHECQQQSERAEVAMHRMLCSSLSLKNPCLSNSLVLLQEGTDWSMLVNPTPKVDVFKMEGNLH